nr:ATP synthase F0 subunit 8 [Otobius lagophilus]
MPQLFPMNWTILYIFFYLTLMLTLIFIHSTQTQKKKKPIFKNQNSLKNWKW